MTTPATTPTNTRGFNLRPATLIALVAVLAPLSYLIGRLSTAYVANTYLAFLASGITVGALGTMIGIPIGLFFGTLRQPKPTTPVRANTIAMERDILTQLRAELVENQALFQARKGNTALFARIEYITPFWTSVMASGRLFVMQDAPTLNAIATAYYWLDQATHLETLAYEAKYAHTGGEGSEAIAAHLISEARLLDGQLDNALSAAIFAIDSALA